MCTGAQGLVDKDRRWDSKRWARRLDFIEQNLAHALLFQGHYASSDEERRNFLAFLPSAAADAARHTRASRSYHTACHVHFLWLAAKLTGQERQFRQLHPSRCIHGPRARRQNAFATIALAILRSFV